MRNVTPRLLIVLSLAIGGGGLVLFGWFLAAGAPFSMALARSSPGRLAVDALLCLLFFVQHSGMIRRSARAWIARRVPASYNPALYSIASGVALVILVLLWQPMDRIVYHLGGLAPWLLGGAALAAIAGFAWGVNALGEFDTFGIAPLRALSRGTAPPSSVFVARGPYRFVRHPLYLFMLVLIWSGHRVTSDRLLFNALWTAWIVVGTMLEERDLRREFGQTYRAYQEKVSMLIPTPRGLWSRGRTAL